MFYAKSLGALAGALLIGSATFAAGPARAALAQANSDSSDKVHVEVTELKRTSGNTVTVKAVIVNDSTKTYNPHSMSAAYLLDTDNRKKLTVAKDEKKKALTSNLHSVPPGGRGEVWAKFGAPADSVQKMTVVIPKFSPMEDVPLGK